jgi:hypothetical protein
MSIGLSPDEIGTSILKSGEEGGGMLNLRRNQVVNMNSMVIQIVDLTCTLDHLSPFQCDLRQHIKDNMELLRCPGKKNIGMC